jgi:hypothetical protein
MASGAKIIILGVLWMANFIILTAMVMISGVITSICNQLTTLVGAGILDYGSISYIFSFMFFLALVTMIAITYKIYQMLASDNMYYPGW